MPAPPGGPVPRPSPSALPRDIEWRLARHARSVGRARTLLREQATSWKLPDEVTETAVLLLSELMTNAYRHAKVSPGRELRARCILNADRLRISVTDANDALPAPRHASPDDESGRGLTLVAALADNWGAEPRPGGIGKTVWFELQAGPLPGRGPGPRNGRPVIPVLVSAPPSTVGDKEQTTKEPRVTIQPDHGQEIIPRPERTPEAVRVALARVAPHRISDMERHKEQALTAAIADAKIGHLQYWLTYWHAQVEIERRPELYARYRAALTAVQGTTSKDDPAFRSGMDDLAAVEAEAQRAVST